MRAYCCHRLSRTMSILRGKSRQRSASVYSCGHVCVFVSEIVSDILHSVQDNSASVSVWPLKPLSDRAQKASITASEAKPAIMRVPLSVCVYICGCLLLKQRADSNYKA